MGLNSLKMQVLTFYQIYPSLKKKKKKKKKSNSKCEYIHRWWRDQKFMEQLSFARDRVVECYIWALGVYYEPKYSTNRRIFVKIIYFITIIDDVYDAYGILDELQLFTQAIQRWDIKSVDKLPNYMKGLYEAILEFYREIEQDMCMDNNITFAFDCAKEAMKRQCRAYLEEAKWFNEEYVPTIEEYMKFGVISIANYVLASVCFLALGNVASEEVFQWVQGEPMLLKAAGVIARLMNDITSHKFEQERGHVVTAVQCYMKQYEATKGEAIAELKRQVVEAWKDLIEDYIKLCGKFPNVILHLGLNLTRAANFYYKERDGFSFVDGETKHLITLLLTMPI
ncbi:sesquiterpene synthase-like [Benincasa hispida]|uniref:sesquiterpene synthase-like n=1 Tax=Benincasa hispida TaxID=102211 RepID=UPI0019017088|nr:sesquiterpene synthase-like [Benincasa hispida]